MLYRQGARRQCRRPAPGAAASTPGAVDKLLGEFAPRGNRSASVYPRLFSICRTGLPTKVGKQEGAAGQRSAAPYRLTSKDSQHGGGQGVNNMMYLPCRACR